MINDDMIDLTENRDFGNRTFNGVPRTDGITWSLIEEVLRRSMGGKFPWSVQEKEYYSFDGLVPLGNKIQRKEAVEVYYWGTKDARTCDCCGKSMKIIPWKKNWGLCEVCLNEQNKQPQFPWSIERIENGIQIFSNGNN